MSCCLSDKANKWSINWLQLWLRTTAGSHNKHILTIFWTRKFAFRSSGWQVQQIENIQRLVFSWVLVTIVYIISTALRPNCELMLLLSPLLKVLLLPSDSTKMEFNMWALDVLVRSVCWQTSHWQNKKELAHLFFTDVCDWMPQKLPRKQ